MSAISSSQQSILGVARVTVAFISLYIVSMLYQIICKKRLLRKARLKGEPLNRYGHPELHNADRLVANLLEWSPIFLGPLWSLAVTDRLDQSCMHFAWAYVILRGLYICLLIKFGVSRNGNNTQLWISTLPSYGCLLFLWQRSLGLIFH